MDAFDAHLEFMGGCFDDEVFGDEPEVEAEPTITAMQWLRSNPTIPRESEEVLAEDAFRKKFGLTPRNIHRCTAECGGEERL